MRGGRGALGREVAAGVLLGSLAFAVAREPGLAPIAVLGALGLVLWRALGGLPGVRPRFAALPEGAARPVHVTFDDIGGQATAKKELQEALEFLRQPDRVRRMGIRPLKGILLTGPPGTGKTLLAKAAATYTGSAFVAAAGSEFIEVYAGVGAQRVRELFRRAREEARRRGSSAIVFIDELEVIGGKRGRHQSHLEYDQTLNQLLVEMDGISGGADVPVLVLAATNRADLLDEALLRPGRFDRVVRVELPDREGRRQILSLHTRGKPLAPDVDLDRVAQATFGFSGAHLESLSNEAAVLALRDGEEVISERHLHEAIDKVLLGERLDRRPTWEERRRIAVHEAGHAVLGELLEPGSVARVTAVPRGHALGFVRQVPREDAYLYTQAKLEAEVQRLLAGALAEELVLGDRSTGAQHDYEGVLDLTRLMVAAGMSDLGIVRVETLADGVLQREQTAILRRLEAKARETLRAHRAALEAVAEVLLEQESLDGDALRRLLGDHRALERAAEGTAQG
jgi:cell division protease FtsH